MTVDITLRQVKGAPLTFNEVDDNFSNLKAAADSASGDLSAIESDVASIDARLTTAEGEIDVIQSNATTLTGRVNAIEADYTTTAEAELIADDAIAAHVALADPHTQYLTGAESVNFAATKSAGDTLALSLPDGATVIVEADESQGGVRVRYAVASGALTAGVVDTSVMARFTQAGTGAVARTAQDKMREFVSVKDFGAVGDGVTDDGAVIRSLLTYTGQLYWPQGTYLVATGKLELTNASVNWIGAGSTKSIIKFADASITAALERKNRVGSQWKLEGLCIDGTSKAIGSNRHGIFSEVDVGTPGGVNPSYDLRFIDVCAQNFSGDGFHITDWFQQYYQGCYARSIAGNGFVISGDQFPTFINSQNFNLNIDGDSWWFQGGSPFLQGLNCGNVFVGLRLGRPASHPRGPSFCRAQLMSLNIEPLYAGGTGVHVHNGSSFAICDFLNIYSPQGAVNAAYGMYFENVSDICFFTRMPGFIVFDGTYANFDHKVYINNVSGNSYLLSLQPITAGTVTGATTSAAGRFISFSSNASGEFVVQKLNAAAYLKNDGSYFVSPRTITAAGTTNIRRDSGVQTDHVVLIDATAGNITISLDFATFLASRIFEFKRIDSSANTVTISSLTANFDGAANISLAALGYTKVVSAGGKWNVLK